MSEGTGKAIAMYGEKAVLHDMTNRILKMMVGTRKLSNSEAATLAQISVMHGLDPFNGEAWYIPGSGVMVGIKGLRKSAKKQLKKTAGPDAAFWVEFEMEARPEEVGAGPNDIVYRAYLRDSETLEAHAARLERYIKLGYARDEARAEVGPSPKTIGTGIYRQGEKTKMNPHECAMKRAEAHAIKQRFDVEFLVSDNDDVRIDFGPEIAAGDDHPADQDDYIEAEFHDQEPAPAAPPAAPPPAKEKKPAPGVDRQEIDDFWSAQRKTALSIGEAKELLSECGQDYKVALEALKKNHIPPEV